MVWSISGGRERLSIGVSNSGGRYICGETEEHTLPINNVDDYEFYEKLRKAALSWIIIPVNETLDPPFICHDEWLERSKATPDTSHAFFFQWGAENDDDKDNSDTVVVVVSIILPVEKYDKVQGLFQQVLNNSKLGYDITTGIVGFAADGVQLGPDTPTFKQFKAGNSYYTSEVEFRVGLRPE